MRRVYIGNRRGTVLTWPNPDEAQRAFRLADKLRRRGRKRLWLYANHMTVLRREPTMGVPLRWLARARGYFYAARCAERHGEKLMLGFR